MPFKHYNSKNTFKTKAEATKKAKQLTRDWAGLSGNEKMNVRRLPKARQSDFPGKRYVIGFRSKGKK